VKILSFKTTWGLPETEVEAQLERIAAAGYDGVEIVLPRDEVGLRRLASAASSRGLRVIPQIQEITPAGLTESTRRAAELGPHAAVVQGGRDRMEREEGSRFVAALVAAQARHGVPLYFETHRLQLLFTPWGTAAYLREFPELRICADFSHWVCVCERLLHDCEDELALAIARTGHIHTRVGHEEGPQVPDPRAPEWAGQRARHEGWWRAIVAAHRARGAAELSFSPEYGPIGYMPALPYTVQALADPWKISLAAREDFLALAKS
jgi:sugar phosphate isomerase/epimerase